jgi:ferredoxin
MATTLLIVTDAGSKDLGRDGSMRIVVDLNKCLGYAQCVPLAPDVLKLSGEEALAYDPNPDDAQRLRVLRAAASCPVQAILVDQLEAKEEAKHEPQKRKRS